MMKTAIFRVASLLAASMLASGAQAQGSNSGGSPGGSSVTPRQPPAAMNGNVVVYQVPAAEQARHPDYAAAVPLPLPQSAATTDLLQAMMTALTAPPGTGTPGFSAGSSGSGGGETPVRLATPVASALGDEVAPAEFGTSAHPFSTARADLSSATNTAWPYRAAGKLFFNKGSTTYVCSAALVKPGVVLTAAHCVSDYGKRTLYTNVRFVPGYRSGVAPYGTWAAASIHVPAAYFAGTDSCAVAGVVCRNDVALIRLSLLSGWSRYVGSTTGWYGVGWDGYGFNTAATNLTQVTQLGYPSCLDSGQLMERNDSYGYRNAAQVDNTTIGSLMCGGSSGGPWLVNFGVRPTKTGTADGSAAAENTVIGVTSWGHTNAAVKQQGASRFTSGNVSSLLNTVCPASSTATYCR